MSNLIAVVGASGTGKSTCLFPHPSINIQGLDPKETLFINIAGKPLPVKGAFKLYPPDLHPKDGGNYIETHDPATIKKVLAFANEETRFRNVVIDDGGYIMGFDTMKRAEEKG